MMSKKRVPAHEAQPIDPISGPRPLFYGGSTPATRPVSLAPVRGCEGFARSDVIEITGCGLVSEACLGASARPANKVRRVPAARLRVRLARAQCDRAPNRGSFKGLNVTPLECAR